MQKQPSSKLAQRKFWTLTVNCCFDHNFYLHTLSTTTCSLLFYAGQGVFRHTRQCLLWLKLEKSLGAVFCQTSGWCKQLRKCPVLFQNTPNKNISLFFNPFFWEEKNNNSWIVSLISPQTYGWAKFWDTSLDFSQYNLYFQIIQSQLQTCLYQP